MTLREFNRMVKKLQREYAKDLVEKKGWDKDKAKLKAETLELSLPQPGGALTTSIEASLHEVIVDNWGHTQTRIQIYPW